MRYAWTGKLQSLPYTDDEVYLADENLRKEYIQSDFGLLYVGWAKSIGPRPSHWNFGQVCSIKINMY